MRADGDREVLRLLMPGQDNAVALAETARTALASALVTAPAGLRDRLRRIPAERRAHTSKRHVPGSLALATSACELCGASRWVESSALCSSRISLRRRDT